MTKFEKNIADQGLDFIEVECLAENGHINFEKEPRVHHSNIFTSVFAHVSSGLEDMGIEFNDDDLIEWMLIGNWEGLSTEIIYN